MADIFVSYASEDRGRIKPLIEVLESQGWSVWWDRDLIAGPSFDEKIEEAIDASRCMVVAWSEHSIKSRWCWSEANEALEHNVLVPLFLDDVRPPLAFRSFQTASLVNWPQERCELDSLLSGIRKHVGGTAAKSTLAPEMDVEKSIAVLPFVNMSTDPEQEFFSDGLSEDILNGLVKISGLAVKARTSSFSFKGKDQDVRKIGQQLNATHILEGSVRKFGDRIRVTAQLIDARKDIHIWSDQYDRDLVNVFEVQDEITTAIVFQLVPLVQF